MTADVTRRTVAGGGTLKLRDGGWYRSREGYVCGPIQETLGLSGYTFCGRSQKQPDLIRTWLKEGFWDGFSTPHWLDLVEEVDALSNEPPPEGDR